MQHVWVNYIRKSAALLTDRQTSTSRAQGDIFICLVLASKIKAKTSTETSQETAEVGLQLTIIFNYHYLD